MADGVAAHRPGGGLRERWARSKARARGAEIRAITAGSVITAVLELVGLGAQAFLPLPFFGSELGAELLRLEHLADLDLDFLVGEGIQPETGDQLL